MLQFPDKDPEEILDYSTDWAQWLEAGAVLSTTGGGCTAALEGTSTPGGLTNITVTNSAIVNNTAFKFWLTGGTFGETYTFKVTVRDNSSPQRVGVRRVQLTITKR